MALHDSAPNLFRLPLEPVKPDIEAFEALVRRVDLRLEPFEALVRPVNPAVQTLHLQPDQLQSLYGFIFHDGQSTSPPIHQFQVAIGARGTDEAEKAYFAGRQVSPARCSAIRSRRRARTHREMWEQMRCGVQWKIGRVRRKPTVRISSSCKASTTAGASISR